jgi:hypothetical protein
MFLTVAVPLPEVHISPIMSEIPVSQSHLSEELQILTEFGYSDLDMPYQAVVGMVNDRTWQ